MAKKTPNDVEQQIEAKIDKAFREYVTEHATEHVDDLKVMQERFQSIKKEVDDLNERLNTLAERFVQHVGTERQ